MNALIENARNVVFDVAQVLLGHEPDKFFPRMLPADVARKLTPEAVYRHPHWVLMDEGTTTHEECAHVLARDIGEPTWWPYVLHVIEHFHEHMTALPTYQLFPRLHAMGKKVFVITNYEEDIFQRAMARFPQVFSEVDGIIISGREHLLKPHPEIYRLLVNRYGLRAEECVFIDDRADNVEGARSIGMQGIVFTSVDDLL